MSAREAISLRYRGDIGPLYRLSTTLVDHGFTFELAPGPTPDVTVVIRSEDRPNHPGRLAWVLDQWRALHPSDEIQLGGGFLARLALRRLTPAASCPGRRPRARPSPRQRS